MKQRQVNFLDNPLLARLMTQDEKLIRHDRLFNKVIKYLLKKGNDDKTEQLKQEIMGNVKRYGFDLNYRDPVFQQTFLEYISEVKKSAEKEIRQDKDLSYLSHNNAALCREYFGYLGRERLDKAEFLLKIFNPPQPLEIESAGDPKEFCCIS